jgi:hypothetical protein
LKQAQHKSLCICKIKVIFLLECWWITYDVAFLFLFIFIACMKGSGWMILAAALACYIKTAESKSQNLTLYRVTPKNYSGVRNMNTGDAAGGRSRVLWWHSPHELMKSWQTLTLRSTRWRSRCNYIYIYWSPLCILMLWLKRYFMHESHLECMFEGIVNRCPTIQAVPVRQCWTYQISTSIPNSSWRYTSVPCAFRTFKPNSCSYQSRLTQGLDYTVDALLIQVCVWDSYFSILM